MNITTGTAVKLIGTAAIADDRTYTVTSIIRDEITGQSFAEMQDGQIINTEIIAAI